MDILVELHACSTTLACIGRCRACSIPGAPTRLGETVDVADEGLTRRASFRVEAIVGLGDVR